MDPVTALGFLAATLTTAAFLPQAVKTWKLKSTKDLSIPTFLLFFFGVCCWLIYGLLIGDLPIILANTITLFLAGAILVQAFIYRQTTTRGK